MSEYSPDGLSKEEKAKWLELLNKKMAYVIGVQETTDKPMRAAVAEVNRQMGQIAQGNKVSKSGGDD